MSNENTAPRLGSIFGHLKDDLTLPDSEEAFKTRVEKAKQDLPADDIWPHVGKMIDNAPAGKKCTQAFLAMTLLLGNPKWHLAFEKIFETVSTQKDLNLFNGALAMYLRMPLPNNIGIAEKEAVVSASIENMPKELRQAASLHLRRMTAKPHEMVAFEHGTVQ